MSERFFKAKLRALIKQECFIQSMSSLAMAGTPDLWISGRKDLWCEVKEDLMTKGAIKPKLSELQKSWLTNRWKEGRNVAVIVGCANKEAILYLDNTWDRHSADRRPLKDVIAQILELVK
jgi:hypothetical protein